MNKAKLEKIKKDILPILKRAGVKKAALFGSYVRGDATKVSDLDILVEKPKGMNLFGMGGLQADLEDALRKKVDLVDYKTIKSRLRDYILNEQVQIL